MTSAAAQFGSTGDLVGRKLRPVLMQTWRHRKLPDAARAISRVARASGVESQAPRPGRGGVPR